MAQMGFLNRLFSEKKHEVILSSPAVGTAVSLSEVNDPAFQQEMLGKGIALLPSEGCICAPCDGVVALMFETGHAVSVTAANGAQVLIHIGLDTVSLKGDGFDRLVQTGEAVRCGQPLIYFDRERIQAKGLDLITPMVICNSAEFAAVEPLQYGYVQQGAALLRVKGWHKTDKG